MQRQRAETTIVRAGRPLHLRGAGSGRFHRDFDALMDELRRAARRTVGRRLAGGWGALFEELAPAAAAPVTGALIEHLLEFAAMHVPGPSGRTVAACAAQAARQLPHRIRRWVAALAESHWDLYEVEGECSEGGLSLRRLYDDRVVRLDAIERDQPLIVGSVVALRLVRDAELTAAPVALAVDSSAVAGLLRRLDLEHRAGNRYESRTEYLRLRGSTVILSEAITHHKRRVLADIDRGEPRVCLVESALDIDDVRSLERAFLRLEVVLDKLGNRALLAVELRDGRAVHLDRCAGRTEMMIFETFDERRAWCTASGGESPRALVPFWRLRRARPAELFPEDVDWLEAHGMPAESEGVVIAERRDQSGRWHDPHRADLAGLIEACRQTARRLDEATDRAA